LKKDANFWGEMVNNFCLEVFNCYILDTPPYVHNKNEYDVCIMILEFPLFSLPGQTPFTEIDGLQAGRQSLGPRFVYLGIVVRPLSDE
jgi:hypothetical protein